MNAENNLYYTQEVLNRHVVIEFTIDQEGSGGRRPYLGQITEMRAQSSKDGKIQTEHLVVFDDGDKVWFDLKEQERMKTLTWINATSSSSPSSMPTKKSIINSKSKKQSAAPIKKKPTVTKTSDSKKNTPQQQTTAKKQQQSATSTTNTPSPPAATSTRKRMRGLRREVPKPQRYSPATPSPNKTPNNKRKSTTTLPNKNKNKKFKPEPVIVVTPVATVARQERISAVDAEWVQEMDYWLKNIPHGPQNTNPGKTLATWIMNKVKKLARGEGMCLKGLPKGPNFYAGVKVDLSFDFEILKREAKEFAKTHGPECQTPRFATNLTLPLQRLQHFKKYKEESSVKPTSVTTVALESSPVTPPELDHGPYDRSWGIVTI